MSQGLFAGATNYQEQTKEDIALDIEKWIRNSKEMKDTMDTSIAKLKDANYWECIPTAFRCYCESVSNVCLSFCSDFNLVLLDIRQDKICDRTIRLLENIFNVSKENEELSWKTYKADFHWKKYGDQNFAVAEELYGISRDFFVTLFDVANAASRLEDYMGENKTVIDNSVHTDNSITIGSGNKIEKSIICNTNNVDKQEKRTSFWSKFWLPLIISIIGGVAVTAICLWLGLK